MTNSNKRNKNTQAGYTVTEILITVWFLFVLCCVIGLAYVAVHFIGRYW